MARSTVAVRFTGDAADLKRSIGDVEGRLGGIGSKIAGFGKVVAAGLAGVAVGAGALAKSAIDAGSDLNETISKSNTVFGDAAVAIDQWSRTAATSFGQSRKQALDAASSFGNMFSQLGIGDQQAADMSKSMTELASDFASFHNADISEVLEAQQAAFRGEYDAVQKFVPTINAAAVEQKALEMGLGDTTKELDAQDKALATQALLMEGAGDAAGDFARTSDGLANKQRIMSARFEDVKAKIGQGLIPVALKLAGFLSDRVLPAFEKVGGGITAFVGAFQNAEDGITSGGFAGFMERLAITARAAFDQISAKVREWGPVVMDVFRQIVAVVQQNWPAIQNVISQVMTTVQAVISGAVSVITTLWQNFGNNIWEFVQRVWPPIQQVIEGVMNTIQGIIKTVTALIKGDWSAVWEGIKQTFSGVWNGIQGIVKTALEAIRTTMGVALEVIGSMFKSAWSGIVDFFYLLPGKVGAIAGRLWEALKQGLAEAVRWIGQKLDSILGPLDEIAKKAGGIVGKLGGTAGKVLGSLPGFDDGGIVPGPIGAPRVVLAHGGETILPTHKQSIGAGIQIGKVVMQAATPAQLRQELEFMLAARGI